MGRYGSFRIFLGFTGLLFFILTIYGLNILNKITNLMNIISIYGDEILRLCIGILTIVIITNYLKSVNIIFDSRVHLKNIDTIKSSENVSDKLDELGYKYR